MHPKHPDNWHSFDEVGLEFLNTAKVKYIIEVDTHLQQQVVWNAFADADTWQHWFPKVELASYDGTGPYGVGTTRRSIVDGTHYDETMLAWDEPRCWGYRINRATRAISKTQLEITEFEATETGTRVRWILACDPLYEIDKQSFKNFLEKMLKEAIQRLEKYISQT